MFSSGSATSQDEHFSCVGHAEHSLSCMNKYLQAGKLCDVVLIASQNNRHVPAHKYDINNQYLCYNFDGCLICLVWVKVDKDKCVVDYLFQLTLDTL